MDFSHGSLLCLFSWMALACAVPDLEYCTATSLLPSCSYQGSSFPGGSAVDCVVRSRFWNGNYPSFDSYSMISGVLSDAQMTQCESNSYLAYRKTLRVRAKLDHFLCADGTCKEMVDIFWHKNETDNTRTLMSRFSRLVGTNNVLPIWATGPPQQSVKCEKEMEVASYLLRAGTLDQCSWGIDSLRALTGTALPTVVNAPYTGRALVGRLEGRVNFSYGHFETSGGCITLLLPVSERMRQWGWTAHPNCQNPKGIYLFDGYFMPAFASPTSSMTANKLPATDPTTLLKNAAEWMSQDMSRDPGRRMFCHELNVALPTDDCEVLSQRTFENYSSQLHVGMLQPSVLLIGGKPILVLDLTNSTEGPDRGLPDFAMEIFRVGAGVAEAGNEPWCTSPGAESVMIADNAGTPFSIYNCSATIGMGLLNVDLMGEMLQDISSMAVPESASQARLGFGNAGPLEPQFVEVAINQTLRKASRALNDDLMKVLSTADVVATPTGAFSVLFLAFVTTFAAVAGIDEVFTTCKRFLRGSGVTTAIMVPLIIGATAVVPPILSLVDEFAARKNSQQDPSVFWTLVPLYATQRSELGPSSPPVYHVATSVVVSYEPLSSAATYPVLGLAIVIALVGTLFAVHRSWRLVRESEVITALQPSVLRKPTLEMSSSLLNRHGAPREET